MPGIEPGYPASMHTSAGLIDVHERIQHANRHNGLLIRQSMKYVDRTLQILSGDDAPTGVYAGSGKLATRNSAGQAVVDRVV